MIMTGENRRAWRQTCPSATISTTNPTWTGLGLNLSLCSDTPETTYGVIVLLRCDFSIIQHAQFAFLGRERSTRTLEKNRRREQRSY